MFRPHGVDGDEARHGCARDLVRRTSYWKDTAGARAPCAALLACNGKPGRRSPSNTGKIIDPKPPGRDSGSKRTDLLWPNNRYSFQHDLHVHIFPADLNDCVSIRRFGAAQVNRLRRQASRTENCVNVKTRHDGWHVDVSFGTETADFMEWRANVKSRGRALVMLFLLSDVGPDDAPTRIRKGSHMTITRELLPHGEAGAMLRQLSANGYASTQDCEIALATGTGAAFICAIHFWFTPRNLIEGNRLDRSPAQSR